MADAAGTTMELASRLDEALPWVVAGLLDGDVETSVAFFSLDPAAQFLAVQALRIAARAAIRTTGVEECSFIASTTESIRGWLSPPLA